MFFRYLLYKLTPENQNVRRVFGVSAAWAYANWRQRIKTDLANWHRRELRSLDHTFDLQEDQWELVRRREVARAQGIGPDDPRYPDLFDIRPFK